MVVLIVHKAAIMTNLHRNVFSDSQSLRRTISPPSTKKVCPRQTTPISILKALWLGLGMLNKFLEVPKLVRFSGSGDSADPVKRPTVEPRKSHERSSSKVRIVHAGGKVEVYFMAIPAYRIMEKYPSHFVTRPEVFRRPWDSVVKPAEILALGKKYYLVPRRTVKKLRRMILNPNTSSREDTNTRVLESLSEITLDSENESHGFRAGGRRKVGTKKQVQFKGIGDDPKRNVTMTDVTKPHDEGDREGDDDRKGVQPKTRQTSSGGQTKRKPKLPALTWRPSLASITEMTHE